MKIISKLIGLSLIGTSVALIGAALAPYIDPEVFVLPAFLGLTYPFLLLLHLLLFVAFLLLYRKKEALVFLIAPALTANIFLNNVGLNFSSKVTNDTDTAGVKITTYNVHGFSGMTQDDQATKPAMLQLIAKEQPDVLGMQDFFSAKQGKRNHLDSLRIVLNTKYSYTGPENPALFPEQALAIVSKYPILQKGYIMFFDKESGNQALFIDIMKNGKPLRVYNVHFESLRFEPEKYDEWGNGSLLGKLRFLYNAKHRFSVSFRKRSKQVKMLKQHANNCPYPYIIAGDFNDTPSSFAVHYIGKGIQNCFREKGRGYRVTFNGGLPDFQIDYIFASQTLEVIDYNILKKKLSDHYPVVATLKLP